MPALKYKRDFTHDQRVSFAFANSVTATKSASSNAGKAASSNAESIGFRRCFCVMSEETTNQKSCGGKKRAMLAYGLVQISATVVSAVSLAAIAVGLCAVKQESRLFNGCVETVVAEGRSQAEAVRYCNGG